MPPSANTAGGRRVTRWTRETIIEKITEWNELYGEPPCSADWNPSLARWRAQEWRADRYRDGIWPSTNAAKRPFDGSFDAAVRAAGLEPHRSGPRRRPARTARPAVEQRAPEAVPRSVERRADGGRRARAGSGAPRGRAGAGRVGGRAPCRRVPRTCSTTRVRAPVVPATVSVVPAWPATACARPERSRPSRPSRSPRTRMPACARRTTRRRPPSRTAREARRTAVEAEARAADAEARADAAERLLEAATAVATRAPRHTPARTGGTRRTAAARRRVANGGGDANGGAATRGSAAANGGAATRRSAANGGPTAAATATARRRVAVAANGAACRRPRSRRGSRRRWRRPRPSPAWRSGRRWLPRAPRRTVPRRPSVVPASWPRWSAASRVS